MIPHVAVWYHGLFSHGTPRVLKPAAIAIIQQAMVCLRESGLDKEADEIWTCFNGAEEERDYAKMLVPAKANIVMHGPDSFAENLTICKLHDWAKSHPDYNILYFHSKGATHEPDSSYAQTVAGPWREAMLVDMVLNWKQCLADLNMGADIVCSRWLWNMGSDRSQHIPAGNFLWTKASFVQTLPSMFLRDRIQKDGIAAASSRYEAEVFWGNGPRMPVVRMYRPNGGGGIP